MRKCLSILLFALACFLAPAARAQVAVTGNLKNLGHANATGSNTFVRFRLNGYGANLPKIVGSNVFVSDAPLDFHPDANGNISGTIDGNDTIYPSGTFYQVCVFFQGIQFRCANYLITGTAFNLNNAVPLTVIPAAGTNQLIMQTFKCAVSVAATTWTCTHNFNDAPVMVNAFDSTGRQIFPDTADVSNPNVTTLTFVTNQSGTALISHAGAVSLATNQPNAVLQNPSAGQVIQGPSLNISSPTVLSSTVPVSGVLLCKNFENVRCVDATNSQGWSGSDLGAWVNAASAGIAAPGHIMVAPGTYTLTTPIMVLSRQQVLCSGNGACIVNGTSLTAGNHFFSFSSLNDVRISGFTLNGPASAGSSGGTGTDVRAVSCTGCTRLEVDHNRFTSVSYGVASSSDIDGNLHDNWMFNIGLEGFSVGTNVSGTQIRNNRIDTVGTSNQHHGIYLQPGVGVLVDGNNISNVQGFCIQALNASGSSLAFNNLRIVNNHCLNGVQAASGSRGGIVLSSASPGTLQSQAIIAHNTIESPGTGTPIDISGGFDVSVDDNTIRNYQNDGILVTGSAGFTTERVTITHNKLFNQTVAGNGIRVQLGAGIATRNVVVADNILDGVFRQCIIFSGVTDSNIHDNRCKDWNIQGSNSNAGIAVDSSSLREKISGNNLSSVNCTGSPASIQVSDAGSTDTQIYGNFTLNACYAPGIFDSGTRTQIWGNHTQTTNGAFELPLPIGTAPFAVTSTTPVANLVAGGNTVTIGSGTTTTNGTGINTLNSQAQPAITIPGALATDTATCSLNAAMPATWQTGIVMLPPVVTANTITVWLSNPTATATITPAATVVRCTVTR